MYKTECAQPHDLYRIESLTNHVFLKDTQGESMFWRFPTLFARENLDHVRIVRENGIPVSVVSYYPSEIKIGEAVIEAASIGAVCTHEESRGKGYADALVKDCFKSMEMEGLDLVLISGTRSLYIRNEAYRTGKMVEYSITLDAAGKLADDGIKLVPCGMEMPGELYKLYSQEEVRFLRNYENFKTLLKGRFAPLHQWRAQAYLLQKSDAYTGYVIIEKKVEDGQEPQVRVVEFAGDREDVLGSLSSILSEQQAPSIRIKLQAQDKKTVLRLEECGITGEAKPIQGTLKILNYPAFMSKLSGRFTKCGIKHCSFYIENDMFFMELDGFKFIFKDRQAVNSFVFGRTDEENAAGLFIQYDEDMLKKVSPAFPIPFADTENLNYI